MKRTNRLTYFIALLLFLAFLAYAGIYTWRALRSTTVTAEAVAADFSVRAASSGLVVRQETVLSAGGRAVDVLAEEGERLAAFAPVASAASNAQGAARSTRRRELDREIARVSAALEGLRKAEAQPGLGVSSAARSLASAVARHDAVETDNSAAVLEALLLGSNASASETLLAALQLERQRLGNGVSADAETLYTMSSGVFSSVVDGWEHLSYRDLRDLTPSSLADLTGSRRAPDPAAYGKLVTDFRWYYAALLAEEDAAALQPGQRAALSFGRRYPGEIPAEVLSVSAPEDGEAAVLFRCDTALENSLFLRSEAAEVTSGFYSGIRIPLAALRTDEETGQPYVWTVTAMALERKAVEPLYLGEDFAIVRRGAESGALREGNTVVVSGDDLYEGKVMG